MKEVPHLGPTNIMAMLHKNGNLTKMICAHLLLLKTIFKHNSMYLMLQVHRTEQREVRQQQTNRF